MSLVCVDRPRFVPEESYRKAVGRMVERFQPQKGLLSIYQIGGASSPGISDIDMLVVFKEGETCLLDPRGGLTSEERYLFIHDLYGISREHFRRILRHPVFYNPRLLWGEDLRAAEESLEEDPRAVDEQIALGYLIRMYVDLALQVTYRILKVRNLLLHVRALAYDLDLLGVESGRVKEHINEVIRWRESWFDDRPDDSHIRKLAVSLFEELADFIGWMTKNSPFCFPGGRAIHLSRKIRISPADRVGYAHRGVSLPAFPGRFFRKYFNLLHRLNSFEFGIPGCTGQPNASVTGYLNLAGAMADYNSRLLPRFLPPTGVFFIR